jgi:serine/threonine protein phosphatase PrpC
VVVEQEGSVKDPVGLVQADEAWFCGPTVQAGTLRAGRPYQEDAFVGNGALWALADGMGGHRDGDVAARVALEALCRTVAGPVDEELLRAGFVAADAAVSDLAEPGESTAPGSTLVAVARRPCGGLLGAWIGDSRAYLVHPDGSWDQLSDDHEDPLGRLTACLGRHGATTFHVDVFEVPTGAGMKVLLCSDGLFGHMEREDLEELLRGGFERLLAATAASSRDNVTAVLVDVDGFAAAS